MIIYWRQRTTLLHRYHTDTNNCTWSGSYRLQKFYGIIYTDHFFSSYYNLATTLCFTYFMMQFCTNEINKDWIRNRGNRYLGYLGSLASGRHSRSLWGQMDPNNSLGPILRPQSRGVDLAELFRTMTDCENCCKYAHLMLHREIKFLLNVSHRYVIEIIIWKNIRHSY